MGERFSFLFFPFLLFLPTPTVLFFFLSFFPCFFYSLSLFPFISPAASIETASFSNCICSHRDCIFGGYSDYFSTACATCPWMILDTYGEDRLTDERTKYEAASSEVFHLNQFLPGCQSFPAKYREPLQAPARSSRDLRSSQCYG